MSEWDRAEPHVLERTVVRSDVDAYRHVNNAVYLRWLDLAAWSHSTALGLSPELCLEMRRGMVVHRVALQYELPAHEDDAVQIGTWIVTSDRRLRCRRRFQIRRPCDARTLLRGWIDYVCVDLESGRPVRMPSSFAAAYAPHARGDAPETDPLDATGWP